MPRNAVTFAAMPASFELRPPCARHFSGDRPAAPTNAPCAGRRYAPACMHFTQAGIETAKLYAQPPYATCAKASQNHRPQWLRCGAETASAVGAATIPPHRCTAQTTGQCHAPRLDAFLHVHAPPRAS